MFYDKQKTAQQEAYKNMLSTIGSLSNLFSNSKKPYLSYRAHENCFCKYFEADNLARHDCSADAAKQKLGIGLKTWVGTNIQKVAEFGKLKKELDVLDNDDLVVKVSEYRNTRIDTTLKMYGLDKLIYHIIIRDEGKMTIEECTFDKINISEIKRLPQKDSTNTCYFTDGNHTYNFNKAKTTLYMVFENLECLDKFEVEIFEDPFAVLDMTFPSMLDSFKDIHLIGHLKDNRRKLALKLYKETSQGNIVEAKSGLNIWNAGGRERNSDEVYIPFNKLDRERPENKDFFPPRDTSFDLKLPDGTQISAKVCQADGKAIMSNPNKDLGKWLLRDVLNLPKNTIITYNLLQEKGFDTVIFEKIDNLHYTIDFTESSVYDELYEIKPNTV